MTRLCMIGVSHRTAPLEIRESLSVTGEALKAELLRLRGVVTEAMVVSTCNRFELYYAPDRAPSPDLSDVVEAALLQRQPAARGHTYRHEGEAAVRHLFRVASSLDSIVVGEPQILGQVKDAYQAAVEVGVVGGVLGQTIPKCFAVAKRVRSETQIGQNSASVASVAVDLAEQIFGALDQHPVLIVGAGKMAELAARHLRQAQVRTLYVVNRTRSRADDLAARLQGTAHDWTELEPLLSKAAVVLCSTGARDPVISKDMVARAMRARRGRWLLLVDIAVPRDVDPRVGDLENVYLYDVDALQGVVQGHQEGRRREAEVAERIVDEELRRFHQGQRAQGVAPLIKSLRDRALDVAHKEVERVLPRLQGASERDRQLVSQMAEAIVNKLLHTPQVALKAEAQAGRGDLAEAVRTLFELGPAGESGQLPAVSTNGRSDGAAAHAAARGEAALAGERRIPTSDGLSLASSQSKPRDLARQGAKEAG